MFELVSSDAGLRIAHERHYLLVDPTELTADELEGYGRLPVD